MLNNHDDAEMFLNFIKQERSEFCKAINEQQWDNKSRTSAENLLIAYDQLVERYSDLTINKKQNNG